MWKRRRREVQRPDCPMRAANEGAAACWSKIEFVFLGWSSPTYFPTMQSHLRHTLTPYFPSLQSRASRILDAAVCVFPLRLSLGIAHLGERTIKVPRLECLKILSRLDVVLHCGSLSSGLFCCTFRFLCAPTIRRWCYVQTHKRAKRSNPFRLTRERLTWIRPAILFCNFFRLPLCLHCSLMARSSWAASCSMLRDRTYAQAKPKCQGENEWG